jgi:FKBP-type peptidyl-prolyl cis-trans isomerase FkpA
MQVKNQILFSAAIAVALVSCKSGDGKFPGYEATETGAYFKMDKGGDGKVGVNKGDVLFIHHIMTTDKDSVLYDYKTMTAPGQPYAMRMGPPVYKGDMFEMMYRLHVGDSASFAMRVDSMFEKYYKQPIPKFLDPKGFIVYHVKVDSLYTSAKVDEIEKKNRALQEAYIEKAKNAEDSIVSKYLADNKITVKPTASGLYIVIKEKGKGTQVKKGDNVEVNYKGMFTDGRVFDASDKHDQAFVFPAGTGQVIPAWDEALLTMNVGTRALLVSPSKLAYGPNGNQGIPPYAPLVFEIDVIGIKSDKK